MAFDLRDKVALITGSSRGIGRGIALELAAAGCHVVLTARDPARLAAVADEVTGRGGKASIYIADLAPESAAAELAEKIAREIGTLDILVNNAGGAKRGGFATLTEQDWQDGFSVKFFSHVRLSRSLWPLLKKSKGSVVFISGIGARAPVGDYMIGATVVGASLAFMRALADIGKEDGVQVVGINPGSVDTDRLRHRLEIIMKSTGLDEAAAREHHRRELDITRFGTPQDVASMVAFAVSRQGSWLHGTAIDIDGGQWVPLRMARYDDPVDASSLDKVTLR